jgi:hypothetical protein
MAVLATAVWRVRPSGVNTNGGGYDPGISGAATDYSRQNAAQATGTNGSTSGAGSTTFTDSTAAAFTSAMVGNCIQIASGTNFQAGFYFVTAFTNANSVVLDRTPSSGGAGSAGVWKLGGGWADFWTNTTSSGPLVPGNIVNILGSGTPNPSAYSFDYTANTTFSAAAGNQTAGSIVFQNDPATPGYKAPPDTTGGMPCVSITANDLVTAINNSFIGLWLVATTPPPGHVVITASGANSNCTVFGCVLDQFGKDNQVLNGPSAYIIGSEVFSSVSAAAGSRAVIYITASGAVIGCNIHDAISHGLTFSGTGTFTIINSIVAKCGVVGVLLADANDQAKIIMNNTIDGNGSHGIEVTTQRAAWSCQIINNIISNHTGVGKFGLVVDAGTAAQNSLVVALADYNTYYNNTANYSGINAGPHDTALGVTPYVASATENFTLA